jgi:hypothetical protein
MEFDAREVSDAFSAAVINALDAFRAGEGRSDRERLV